eukprot:Rmarinus@m.6453
MGESDVVTHLVDALVDAARNADTPNVRDILQQLTPEICDLPSSRNGTTALVTAVTWGYDAIFDLLMQHGADVNATCDGTLWAPLHAAAMQERGKMVMKLLNANAKFDQVDIFGRTPAHYASLSDEVWPFF